MIIITITIKFYLNYFLYCLVINTIFSISRNKSKCCFYVSYIFASLLVISRSLIYCKIFVINAIKGQDTQGYDETNGMGYSGTLKTYDTLSGEKLNTGYSESFRIIGN